VVLHWIRVQIRIEIYAHEVMGFCSHHGGPFSRFGAQ
jgi:hypothetical protein